MSPILHPTDFADFALLYKIGCCLAIARQQQWFFRSGEEKKEIYIRENIFQVSGT